MYCLYSGTIFTLKHYENMIWWNIDKHNNKNGASYLYVYYEVVDAK